MNGPALRLFGPVTATARDGSEVALGGARQRALLGWLALHLGRPAGVEGVIDAIWGDDPPVTVTNTIQVYVSSLRRALAPLGAKIERRGDTYVLQIKDDDVDVARFEGLAAEGRAALRAGTVGTALDRFGEALALTTAPLMVGLDAHPFVAASRVTFGSMSLAVSLDHVSAMVAVGRAPDAVSTAERLVSENPFDEGCWEALMMALYHAGRQHESLRAFQRARSVLTEELGIEPSPRLRAIESAVLQQNLPVPFSSGDRPVDSRRTDDGTALPPLFEELVGREDLIAEVVRHCSDSRLVTLCGLGGVGKTSVAVAAAHRLVDRGMAVCFADVATSFEASAAMDVMCRAVGLEAGEDPLASLASSSADVCIVVDNAEQVQGLALAVSRVLSSSGRLRMLVTSRIPLTIRHEHMIPVPPLAVAGGAAAELFVRRAAACGGSPSAEGEADAVAALCELAGGVPLAIEILATRTRSASPRQLLEELRHGQYDFTELPGPVDLPDRQRSVAAVVSWALSGVSPSARRALERLAVVGGAATRPFAMSLMDDISDAPRAIDELILNGLVQRADPDGRLRVLPPVAEHVRHLGAQAWTDAEKCLVAHVTGRCSAEDSMASLRLLDEHAAVDTALRVVLERQLVDAAIELLTGLGRYWLVSGRTGEAIRFGEAVAALPLDRQQTAVAAVVRGQVATWANRADAKDLLEAGLSALQPEDRWLRTLVNGWCYLGSWYMQRDCIAEAHRCADRAAEAAAGHEELEDMAPDFRAMLASHLGDWDSALQLGMDALATAELRDDRFVVIDLLQRTAEVLVELDRVNEADLLITRAFTASRTEPLGLLLPRVLNIRAIVDLALGRIQSARSTAIEVVRSQQRDDADLYSLATALRTLAAVSEVVGERGVAALAAGAADHLLRTIGVPPTSCWVGPTRTVLGALAEDPDFVRISSTAAATCGDIIAAWTGPEPIEALAGLVRR